MSFNKHQRKISNINNLNGINNFLLFKSDKSTYQNNSLTSILQ